MRILILEWPALGNSDICESLRRMGHETEYISFSEEKDTTEIFESRLRDSLRKKTAEALFSFNYFPVVSECCNAVGLRYISWVYDSPYINIYSYTVLNEVNSIYVFDYGVYEEFRNNNIPTVRYMPLGINVERYSKIKITPDIKAKYGADISFVGSLYTEKKHNLYSKFDSISEEGRGYLDALIRSQMNIYGVNILEDLLTESVLAEMETAYPTNPDSPFAMSPRKLYAEYVLSRKVTSLERQEILRQLSEYMSPMKTRIDLYTHDQSVNYPGIRNRGVADYYSMMPYIFGASKINLNITLRSIKTGIPLRALDILGSGGLLISNYQEEFFEYFSPGNDMVIYENISDLVEKCRFYLEHEDERERIAENGRNKAFSAFDQKSQLAEMLSNT